MLSQFLYSLCHLYEKTSLNKKIAGFDKSITVLCKDSPIQ